ncbi:energy transducer TonB [Spirosoma spitsbergense]|uniref:energy transducer TonB n=1 Tax=Spirosoma spitsbergense TaxID=431554 RepID=UPI0003692CF6|nr:energy transducer TonB [Spirosoma spitsbergense]
MQYANVSRQLLFIPVLCLASFFFLLNTSGFAQKLSLSDTTVYTIVEHQPEFQGGFGALKTYMLANVHYPAQAQEAKVKDRVFISFIVERDGTLSDIRMLKGVGYGCDEEAIRVIKSMPRWIPGSQSGEPIRVKYNLPVLFGIDYSKVRVR